MATQTPAVRDQFVVTYDLTGTFMLPKKFSLGKLEGLLRFEIMDRAGAYMTVVTAWNSRKDFKAREREFLQLARIPAGAEKAEGGFIAALYPKKTLGQRALTLLWNFWLVVVHAGAGLAIYWYFPKVSGS